MLLGGCVAPAPPQAVYGPSYRTAAVPPAYGGGPPRGWDAACRAARRDLQMANRRVQQERREARRDQAWATDAWDARREAREARQEIAQAQRGANQARWRAAQAC
jgi:hypothetical protein